MFGVTFRRDSDQSFAYVRLRDTAWAERVTALPIYIDQTPLEVGLAGAEVLADLYYPEALRTAATTVLWGDPAPDETRSYPAIVQHDYDQGRCWYATWPVRTRGMPNAWIKRLILALVERALPSPVLTTSAPPGVEVTLNRQADRHAVHLVNYHTGAPDRLSFEDNGLVLSGMVVQIDVSRLGSDRIRRVYAPPDVELPYTISDGKLRVVVPPLRVHAMLVIE